MRRELRPMSIFFVICLFAGAALGQRFKVLVLIPASALSVVAAVIIANSATAWYFMDVAIITLASLQIGYFAGSGIRSFATRVSANRIRNRLLSQTIAPPEAPNRAGCTCISLIERDLILSRRNALFP